MSTSQIASLILVIVIISGGMFYFMMRPKTTAERDSECVVAATALPLVNTTTGIAMTAAIAECDE